MNIVSSRENRQKNVTDFIIRKIKKHRISKYAKIIRVEKENMLWQMKSY